MRVDFKIALVAAICVLSVAGAARAACPNARLSKGTIADADQVMDWLDCKASLEGAVFTGDVGIGTLAPSNALDVTGGVTMRGYMNIYQSGTTFSGYFGSGRSLFSSGPSGSGDLGMRANGAIGLAANGSMTPQFVLNSNGRVGIGTVIPDNALDVAGGVTMRGYMNIYQSGTTFSGYFGSGRSLFSSGPSGSGDLGMRANGAIGLAANGSMVPQFVLDANGRVGIGTVTPAQNLEVAGTIRQSGCTTATTLSATTSGDIICTPSDARLKEIYGRYNGGLPEIARLIPVRFRYKSDRGNPARDFEHAGFVAQDLEKIIPQAVAKQKNGYYALDTTAILAASINAIKDLQRQLVLERNARAIEVRRQRDAVRILETKVRALEHRPATKVTSN